MRFQEIADVVQGRILAGRPDAVFTSFHNHSDDARPGSFYFCLKGARVDGHDFLSSVYEAGCRGASVTDEGKFDSLRGKIPGMCIVLVEDATEALANLGKYIINKLQPSVVAITGSVGKTTTKEMAARMLGNKYAVGYSPGNLNTEIGLPIALLNFGGSEEVVVLEMAARGFGQIAHLCGIAQPDVAVITNIGHSHIECFGDTGGVRKAKMEIVHNMKEGGTAVITGDDAELVGMAEESGKPFITFGTVPGCEYRLGGIDVCGEAVGFSMHHDGYDYQAEIEYGSRGDAYNCVAAVAAAHILGLPIRDALDSVRRFKPVEMRLDRREGPNSSLMFVDCYNANPESMCNSVELAASARRTGGRLIAVLGDMLELGDTSSDEHASLGSELAGYGVDLLLAYGKEILATVEKFMAEGGEVHHFKSHGDIAQWLMNSATEMDVILIKGSRGMALEKVVELLKNEA